MILIVGDFNNTKPFMVVKYFRGNNNYVGHKILGRFKTEKEATAQKTVEVPGALVITGEKDE